MTAPVVDYDPRGPLPRGKLALQASAGTGKTYVLAELACRFIAEGRVETSGLLVVTFTRAATNELRGRIRDRLVRVARDLRTGTSRHPSDRPLVDLLASTVGTEPALARLDRAVTEFDAATVTTIHGFAHQMLAAIGVTSGVDPGFRLLADTEELCLRTGSDALVGAAVDPGFRAGVPSLRKVTAALGMLLDHPDLVVVPDPDEPDLAPELVDLRQVLDRSVALAERFRDRGGLVTFNDLLVRLRDRIRDGSGAGTVDLLRRRFRTVLIDEFQDTDAVQWDIFSSLFDHPDHDGALVLVGDPKQAIYGFRGADVHTYLRAVGSGAEVRSLTTNWRADAPVLRSLETLLSGTTFGSPAIPFVPVGAAPGREESSLRGADGTALPALDLRIADGEGIAAQGKDGSEVQADSARSAIHADVAERLVELLGRATITDDGTTRPVHPGDVAVLVPAHAQAGEVQRALAAAGVPAVLARGGSVLETTAADHLRWLLEAMARPGDVRAVRMYALSWFAGWTPERLATAADDDLAGLQEDVRRWSERLGAHAPAEVFAEVFAETGLASRVLARDSGDRDMTDLDHLVEYLGCDLGGAYVGAAGLLAVLDRERTDEDEDGGDPEDVVARRVESDAAAVQIMTIWAAKGLEFPIVFVPHLWQSSPQRWPLRYVDPDTDRWVVDLAPVDAREGKEAKLVATRETYGERQRLLYVALTRARHQTVVWWAPGRGSGATPLARILFARSGERAEPASDPTVPVPTPRPGDIADRLAPLAQASGGTIRVTQVDRAAGQPSFWEGRSVETPCPLELATLAAVPGRLTRRWSFSALVDDAGHEVAVDPALVDGGAADEQEDERRAGEEGPTGPGPGPSGGNPMADLPAGARFGNLVHAVLEAVDFAAPDLEGVLDAAIGDELAWRSVDLTPLVDPERGPGGGRQCLVAGLASALRAPLGGPFGGIRLADVSPTDRLTEVSFDFRLAGGGQPRLVRDLGAILRDGMGADDPLADWAAGLAGQGTSAALAGHLTGSIDLVVRLAGDGGSPRFVVCDYKTNALHRRGEVPDPEDYGRDRMATEMSRHDYPLQAALYTVALHRYLRWRVADYDPDVHLGGSAYLFVRGMGATGSGAGSGVYDWRFPTRTVVALSDALDGVGATVGASGGGA